MTRRICLCLLFFSLLFSTTSCARECNTGLDNQSHSVDDTSLSTKTLSLSANISSMALSAGMPVKYVVSDKNSVVINAPQTIIDRINVTQNNNTLSISPKNSISNNNRGNSIKQLHITVYAPAINTFALSSGSSLNADEYRLPNLTISTSSGATVNIRNIAATSVKAAASSGAEIKLSGKSESVVLSTSSGALINTANLMVNTGSAAASSGGDIVCNVENLKKTTSSGGSVKNKN